MTSESQRPALPVTACAAALRECGVLDTLPEPDFDDLAELAIDITGCPIAAISFIDGDRLWFKSIRGFDGREARLEASICAMLLEQPDRPLVISDTHQEVRLNQNPQVRDGLQVRSYLGVALRLDDGIPLGSLNTADYVVRDFTPQQIDAIQRLGRQVEAQLKLRSVARRLEAARLEAEVASRAKSAFLSNMSHEIRTPMNGILGLATLLKTTELNEVQSRYVDSLDTSAATLMVMMSDILDYSDLLNDRTTLSPRPTDLNELVQEVDQLMRPTVTIKGLRFRCIVSYAITQAINADSLRLRQVLLHLVDNAAKFTLAGSIELQVMPHGDTIRFVVRDTGIGVPEEQLTQLGLPFNRPGDHRRTTGGRGLGLSIVNELLRLMGTTLQVESRVGIGSTFWFDLPQRSPS